MPIYEYRAAGSAHCRLCGTRFEVRQKIDDAPLGACPKCGAEVRRLISRSFIALTEPLSPEETFQTHTEEEADRLGLEGGFARDEIWD
ncbi:MAG: zinc ribbon domain-containing protein [Chloroflexi bacterium]|nr:zinc ribbon domain-containing protein [Chloroflexota bacterium]